MTEHQQPKPSPESEEERRRRDYENERSFKMLTERGPGDKPCGLYLRLWIIGQHDSEVMTHINECAFCGPIIYGDGIDFHNSVDEEVALHMRAARLKKRRKFLAASAAAAAVVLAIGAGLTWQPAKTGEAISNKLPAFERFYEEHDQMLAVNGRSVIDAKYAGADSEERILYLRWILKRNQVTLYDIVVMATSDQDPIVRTSAIGCLYQDPIAFKPYLPQLEAIVATEQDGDLQARFLEMLEIVKSS